MRFSSHWLGGSPGVGGRVGDEQRVVPGVSDVQSAHGLHVGHPAQVSAAAHAAGGGTAGGGAAIALTSSAATGTASKSEKSSPPPGDSGDSGAAAGGAGGSFISHAAQFVASAGLNKVQRGQLRSAMDAHRLYGRKIKFQQQLEMRATAAPDLTEMDGC